MYIKDLVVICCALIRMCKELFLVIAIRVLHVYFLCKLIIFLFVNIFIYSVNHRLNMELDLQSLFELLCTAVLVG